jgi:predicted LPLAT superfamily acyltransferase
MNEHSPSSKYPHTPDGRYFVVRGRLWRASNPFLDEQTRRHLVKQLMSARRAVRQAKGDPDRLAAARSRVDTAKVALGERGPVWWNVEEPDFNRQLVRKTPYAAWFSGISK